MTRSLRIAKILLSSKFYGHSIHEIDLGSNLIFIEVTYPEIAYRMSEWELYSKKHPKSLIGYLNVVVYPEIGHTVGKIDVVSKARGQGLGEKMVQALVNFYGSLSSDPQGSTSPDAIRMWQRMGAEKVSTDQNANGYFYRLTK